jgi:hypothetical protein
VATTPEKLSCVCVPVKTLSVSRKLRAIEERRKTKLFRRVTGSKVKNPKNVLGSSLSKDVRFTDNNNTNFILFNYT